MHTKDLSKNLAHQSDEFQEEIFAQLQDETTPEVALKILAKFIVNLNESRKQIENALREGASETAWRACHKLAASADLIGFGRLAEDNRALSRKLQNNFEIGFQATELHSLLLRIEKIEKAILKCFPQYKSYL